MNTMESPHIPANTSADYDLCDELPPQKSASSSLWERITDVARSNRGKWVRYNRRYATARSASAAAQRVGDRYDVEAASRDGYVYVRAWSADD